MVEKAGMGYLLGEKGIAAFGAPRIYLELVEERISF